MQNEYETKLLELREEIESDNEERLELEKKKLESEVDVCFEERLQKELALREKGIKQSVYGTLELYRTKIKNELEKEYESKFTKLERQIERERIDLKTELSKYNKLKSKLNAKINEVE